MPTHQATRYGEFFTLFGGIIALSGFFILKIEETGINVSGSWGTPFNHFYLDQMRQADVSREFNLEIIERSIKFGSWGTVIGFIVAAIGMFLNIKK